MRRRRNFFLTASTAALCFTALHTFGVQANHIKKSCKPPAYPEQTAGGYFRTLAVEGGATCTTGRAVALGYFKCRTNEGGLKGRGCSKKVLMFTCTEKAILANGPLESNGRVTCRRGAARRVVHTYQQNLNG